MANSYTATPSVIPGKLTVGGDLDVKGTVLVGPFTSRLRLFSFSDGEGDITFNLGSDRSTQDEANQSSAGMKFGPLPGNWNGLYTKGGGSPSLSYLPFVIDGDCTAHSHTGDVTLDQIYSNLVPGGIMGTHGMLRATIVFAPTVQGAGTSNVYLNFGAQSLNPATIVAADVGSVYRLVLIFGNSGANNAQTYSFTVYKGSVIVFSQEGVMGVNTVNSVAFSVTVQNANSGDTQFFYQYLLEFLRT
jgi:hypothetical protein